MRRNFAFALPLILTATIASPCQADDWLVYTSAQAGVNPSPVVTDTKCSGTRASLSYCGSNATILSNQTALVSSASATNTAPYANILSYQHGDGYASADLASGKLRVSDHAVSQGAYHGEATLGGGNAQFQDSVRFASTLPGPFGVTVHLHVDGSLEGAQQTSFGFSLVGRNVLSGSIRWSDATDGVPSCVGTPGPICTQQASYQTFNVSSGWQQFGPSDFNGTLLVDPRSADYQLSMSLFIGANAEYLRGGVTQTYADFGHTASISFDLPEGVTVNSASGVFLTQQDTAAVPEPATWAMMLAGFGVIGGVMRRIRVGVAPRAARLAFRRS